MTALALLFVTGACSGSLRDRDGCWTSTCRDRVAAERRNGERWQEYMSCRDFLASSPNASDQRAHACRALVAAVETQPPRTAQDAADRERAARAEAERARAAFMFQAAVGAAMTAQQPVYMPPPVYTPPPPPVTTRCYNHNGVVTCTTH